jgi:hypothetical protein
MDRNGLGCVQRQALVGYAESYSSATRYLIGSIKYCIRFVIVVHVFLLNMAMVWIPEFQFVD